MKRSAVLSLSVVQQRAQKAINTMMVGDLDPDQFCAFYWLAPSQEIAQEITREAFLSDTAPPGTYTFVLLDADGTEKERIEGVKVELRDDPEPRGNVYTDLVRATSVLQHNCGSEVERVHRRLRQEEERADKAKAEADVLRAEMRDLQRYVDELETRIEELEDEDGMDRLAQALEDVLCDVFGIERPDAEQKQAFEVIVQTVKTNSDVQRALIAAGAKPALALLGLGEST